MIIDSRSINSSRSGFSLIELLLAIVIVATMGVALMFGFSRRISNVNYQLENEGYLDLIEEYRSASGSGAVESVEAETGLKCGYRNGAAVATQCVWIGYYMQFDLPDANGQVPRIFVRPVMGSVDATTIDRPLTLKEYDPYIPTDSSGRMLDIETIDFKDTNLQVYGQHRIAQRTSRANTAVRYASHDDSEGNSVAEADRQYLRGIGFTNINISSAVFETDPSFQGSVTGNKGNMFMVFSRAHDSGDTIVNGNLNVGFDDRPALNLVHGADMSGTYCVNSERFSDWVRFAFGRFESSTTIEKSPLGRDGKDICAR